MNHWLRDILREYLILEAQVSASRVDDVVEGLHRKLQERHMTIVPDFLSDEMFDAQRQFNPDLDYAQQNRLYTRAINAYRQLALTD